MAQFNNIYHKSIAPGIDRFVPPPVSELGDEFHKTSQSSFACRQIIEGLSKMRNIVIEIEKLGISDYYNSELYSDNVIQQLVNDIYLIEEFNN